jgi:threonyl-tRNA synthetase
MERFFGILIEHYGGAFPVWLAPVQAIILPISEKHAAYAQKVYEQLVSSDVRAELDQRNESISKRVREAELQKIPFILACGDREIASRTVMVRTRGKKEQKAMEVTEFVTYVKEVIEKKL